MSAVTAIIDQERDGEVIDRSVHFNLCSHIEPSIIVSRSLLKEVVDMFVSMGMGSLDVYVEELEVIPVQLLSFSFKSSLFISNPFLVALLCTISSAG